jgi:hypothetical protein
MDELQDAWFTPVELYFGLLKLNCAPGLFDAF